MRRGRRGRRRGGREERDGVTRVGRKERKGRSEKKWKGEKILKKRDFQAWLVVKICAKKGSVLHDLFCCIGDIYKETLFRYLWEFITTLAAERGRRRRSRRRRRRSGLIFSIDIKASYAFSHPKSN